ncbi:MAG: sodium-dependent transporter, partial [Glaciecola sp.]
EKRMSRQRALLLCGLLLIILSLMCAVSFGMIDFLTGFMSYAGAEKSFFDVVIDVFYETILPLNGLLICLFVSYRWKKHNLSQELAAGSEGYSASLFEKYVNVSVGTFIPIILLVIFINTVTTKYFGVALIG